MGNNLGGRMGRAIDMGKSIDAIKVRLSKVENALARVINVVDSMEEKAQTTTHVDLHDIPEPEEIELKEEITEELKPKTKAKKSKKRSKVAA